MLYTYEQEEAILHLCDQPLPVGSTVEGVLDFERRFANMQIHSGEHILSGLILKELGLHNVGFHMGHESNTIDLDGEISAEQVRMLEEKAAAGTMSAAELENQKKAMELVEKYEAAMEDDFNTADAVSAVFELVKLSNSTASAESTGAYVGWMKETIERLCGVLGIITEKKEEILDSEIEDMIAQRQAARKAKDFALADQIRGKLLDMGIILEDTREGVKWKRA